MTNLQENKMTMYETVQTLLAANAEKTADIPAFAAAFTSFTDTVNELKETDKNRGTITSGKTAAKQQKEDELITDTLRVGGAIESLGEATGDEILKSLGKVTDSGLRRERDTQLINIVQSIIDTAEVNQAALAEYGITETIIADLTAKLVDYSAALGDKESSLASRAAFIKSLKDLFRKTDDILRLRIDTLMQKFREADSVFYDEYKSARRLRNLGRRTRIGEVQGEGSGTVTPVV